MSEVQPKAIPWFDIDPSKLPSRGICYPPGTKIRYRTYSFGEVKLSSIGKGQILEILESNLSGISTEPMPKDQLTFMDALYIGVLRKVSTIRDGEYTVPYTCDMCGAEGEKRFRESDLEFDEMSAEVVALPLKIELLSVLDTTGAPVKLEFAPLKVRDFVLLQKGRYQKEIKGGELDRVAMDAAQVLNMDFKSAYNTLYNLTDQDDIDLVKEVDKLLMHDLKPLKAVCSETNKDTKLVCNHENLIVLQGREQMIRPFRDRVEPLRSRISFGVSQPS